MLVTVRSLALLTMLGSPAVVLAQEPTPTVESMPPVVVETFPRTGVIDVAPGRTEIKVTFSKGLADESWSWSTAWLGSAAKTTGEPRFVDGGRTCVLPVELEAGRTYGYWLNGPRATDFKDRAGHAAVPYLLVFATAASDATAMAKVREDLDRIEKAVARFMVDHDRAAPTWEQLLAPGAKGVRYLELDHPLLDPWGRRYVIRGHYEGRFKQATVASCGPDGQEGSSDDIVVKAW